MDTATHGTPSAPRRGPEPTEPSPSAIIPTVVDPTDLAPDGPPTGERTTRPEAAATTIDQTPGLAPDTLGMTVATEPDPSFRVPGFTILRVVGRGGMGVVYQARQHHPERDVALKVLPPALARDPVRLRRFHNEGEIAARLADAHILPIYEVLDVGGSPVLVMPFIESDLSKILAERKAALRAKPADGRHSGSGLDARTYLDRVQPLLDQLVEAVAALHAAGVIHRDIKPSNVLVDHRGNVWLTDFGLARLGLESGMTVPGVGMGSPGYMSPEQWDGLSDVDARADVFGLGATIYHALTLRLPFARDRVTPNTPLPPPPSRRGGPHSSDLGAVVIKAIEPDRRDRYATGDAFRDDWRAVREGRDPVARRRGPLARLGRRVRRHPWAAASIALAAMLVLVIGAWFWPVAGDVEAGPIPSTATAARVRVVHVVTDPIGARVVMARIDDQTGEPSPHQPYRPAGGRRSPARLTAPPGDYLVVVAWEDGNFHEVYRHVPGSGERPLPYRHRSWRDNPDGSIRLPVIKAPKPEVTRSMARFNGAVAFAIEASAGTASKTYTKDVAPFWLDQTEYVGWGPLGKAGTPTAGGLGVVDGPGYPIRALTHDMATHLAELAGKRLPDEAEFMLAATNSGQTRYPWGNDIRPLDAAGWTFGPAGKPEFDRTQGDTPISGLYSNVAEYTSSWITPSLSVPRAEWPPDFDLRRVVRGGPPSVARGEPRREEFERGILSRPSFSRRDQFPKGVGFRGARSARPRFLDGAQ